MHKLSGLHSRGLQRRCMTWRCETSSSRIQPDVDSFLQVWPGRVDHVTAVEPSGAMVDMGLRIQQALQEHNPAKRMPNIRWLGRLPKAPRGGATGPPDKRRYDLTVAVHALTHVVDRSERMRIVRDLWTRSNGILVIMEPGTPVGSSAVREARSQLLREENKRQVQVQVLSSLRLLALSVPAHECLRAACLTGVSCQLEIASASGAARVVFP